MKIFDEHIKGQLAKASITTSLRIGTTLAMVMFIVGMYGMLVLVMILVVVFMTGRFALLGIVTVALSYLCGVMCMCVWSNLYVCVE